MILLKRNKEEQVLLESLEHFTFDETQFLDMYGKEQVREMISKLKPDTTMHYIARMYNMHDVFADLIKLSGPANVKILTYSITEFPLRILSQFHEKGIIKHLDIILDFTISRTPDLKQFAGQTANRIRYIENHAKLLLIENENWKIIHTGSANFTKNNRFELGTIITIDKLFDQYSLWFENLFNNAVE